MRKHTREHKKRMSGDIRSKNCFAILLTYATVLAQIFKLKNVGGMKTTCTIERGRALSPASFIHILRYCKSTARKLPSQGRGR